MAEKFPKPKKSVPGKVREAWRIEDYATRRKALSALGKSGNRVKSERAVHTKDIADAKARLDHERLLSEKERQSIPRDIVNEEGDVIPNPDYWDKPLDEED